MKKYLYLMAFMLVGQQTFAQTQKVYITKSGDITANSNRGSSYLVVKKLNDTTYLSLQYDMHNKLMSKGTYKDGFLTIPNGKFTYYDTEQSSIINNVSYNETSPDNSHIARAGYFANGIRNGMWRDFSGDNEVASEYSYKNNVLNGPYKIYTSYPDAYGEGTMVNGKLDGKFDYYNNGLLVSEYNYSDGKVKSKEIFLKPATERKDMQVYLEHHLYKYAKVMYNSKFTLKFIVAKDGKITNAQIINGYNPEINQAVLGYITEFDGFDPARYKNTPVDQQYTKVIYMYSIEKAPNYVYPAHIGIHNSIYTPSRPINSNF